MSVTGLDKERACFTQIRSLKYTLLEICGYAKFSLWNYFTRRNLLRIYSILDPKQFEEGVFYKISNIIYKDNGKPVTFRLIDKKIEREKLNV